MLADLWTGLDFSSSVCSRAEGADTSADQIRLGVSTDRFSQDVRFACCMWQWEIMSTKMQYE